MKGKVKENMAPPLAPPLAPPPEREENNSMSTRLLDDSIKPETIIDNLGGAAITFPCCVQEAVAVVPRRGWGTDDDDDEVGPEAAVVGAVVGAVVVWAVVQRKTLGRKQGGTHRGLGDRATRRNETTEGVRVHGKAASSTSKAATRAATRAEPAAPAEPAEQAAPAEGSGEVPKKNETIRKNGKSQNGTGTVVGLVGLVGLAEKEDSNHAATAGTTR